jgi:hypothetical protein
VCRLQVILGVSLQHSCRAIADIAGVVDSRSRPCRAWSKLELVFSSIDSPYFVVGRGGGGYEKELRES